MARLGWWLGLTVVVTSSAGADVPGSALSSSMATPPEFVDERTLAFELPHRTASGSAGFLSLSDERNVSATAHVAGVSLAAMTRVIFDPVARVSDSVRLAVATGGRRGLQFGISASLARRDSRMEDDEALQLEAIEDSRDITLGLGWASRRLQVDVAGGIVRSQSTSEQEIPDRQDLRFGGEAHRATVSTRIRVGRVKATQGVLYVGWAAGRPEFSSRVRTELVTGAWEWEPLVRDWSAGLSLSTRSRWADRAGVSVYVDRTTQLAVVRLGGRSLWTRDTWAGSAFAERRLRPGLVVRGGVGFGFRDDETDVVSVNSVDGSVQDRSRRQTGATFDTFGWGLSGQWKRVEITGAMQSDFSLSDPFASIDVHIRL